MIGLPLSLMAPAVPLAGAALCMDCRTIATQEREACPACGSGARMRLAPILERPTIAGAAAVYTDAGAPATICLYSGRSLQPLNARPSDICIEDIAHALANQCRFGGHTKRFYSVAEHSIYVSRLVPKEQRLAALLHDASEAYLIDLPTPLKVLPEFAAYRQAEEHLMQVIGEALGFNPQPTFELMEADQQMLAHEMRELIGAGDGQDEHDRYVGRFHCRFAHVEGAFLTEYDKITGLRRGRVRAS